MNWGKLVAVTILSSLIFFSHWPKLKNDARKIRMTVITIVMLGWVLGILLVINPNIPGPGQLIDLIFKPIGKYWNL